jgi:hypothetical protein
MWFMKSKKVLLTMMAIIAVTVATLTVQDIERLQWFAGIVGGLVGTYNLAQGLSDGLSKGRTSSGESSSTQG